MIIILVNLFNIKLMVQLHAELLYIKVGFCTKNKILQNTARVALNYLYNTIIIKSRLIYRWIVFYSLHVSLHFRVAPYSRYLATLAI